MTKVFTKLKHLRFMNSYIYSIKKFELINFVKMEKASKLYIPSSWLVNTLGIQTKS